MIIAKYIPIFVASLVMMGSFLFKVLFADLKWTYFLRDLIVFMIIYYVVKVLIDKLSKALKNYWKIL